MSSNEDNYLVSTDFDVKTLMSNIIGWMCEIQGKDTGSQKLDYVLRKANYFLGITKFELYKDLIIEIVSTLKFLANNKDLQAQLQRLSIGCSSLFKKKKKKVNKNLLV